MIRQHDTMIPYEQRQLELAVVAYDVTKWPRPTCNALLEVIEQDAWRTITEMQASVDDPWEPYRREQATEYAVKRGVRLRASPEVAFEASLHNGGRSNAVSAWLTTEVFESGSPTAVEQWISHALVAFDGAQIGSARADDEQMMVKRENGLRTLPLFRDLGWLHVLCPSAYPSRYDREALLAAPCYRVEERLDGTIWIWVYEQPLRYDDPESRESMVRLSKYLQAHVKS